MRLDDRSEDLLEGKEGLDRDRKCLFGDRARSVNVPIDHNNALCSFSGKAIAQRFTDPARATRHYYDLVPKFQPTTDYGPYICYVAHSVAGKVPGRRPGSQPFRHCRSVHNLSTITGPIGLPHRRHDLFWVQLQFEPT